MLSGGPSLVVGAGVALPLRRWPVLGLVLGALVAWVVHAGGLTWPPRSLATVAASVVVLTRLSRRATVWWGAMAIVASGTVFTWTRPLATQAAVGAGIWIGLVMLGEGLAARPARGGWGVVTVAGVVAAVLLGLSGSVVLAVEALLVTLPAVGLWGRPLDAAAGRAVALLLGMAWVQGLLFSELGPWICVPLACLMALRIGQGDDRHAGWKATAAAAAIGGVGAAPLVVDWLRNPPF